MRDAMTWHLGVVPETVAGITVDECKPGNAPRLLFSAMDASVATEIERAFAQAGHVVVSNSRNHRMERDVPLLVPEINPDHLKLVPGQQRARGWNGQIVTNPNCSTIGLTMGLGPLKPFGITKVHRHHHAGHLGRGLSRRRVHGHRGQRGARSSAAKKRRCSRRPRRSWANSAAITSSRWPPRSARTAIAWRVVDGHTETVSVEFSTKPSEADLRHAFETFRAVPQERALPSAPPRPVIYMEEANRPQPRKDAERERGMAAFIGRLRPCPVLDYKFVVLSHNTVRGAAGAAVLNAELMHSEGMLD